MNISKSDIRNIASLARLDVDPQMLDLYASELSDIMRMIREMQQIETDAIEPMPHPQDMALRLREDTVTETQQRDLLQRIAPQISDGLYLVPKVLD